jgi:thiol-disulfide isomerase/thioredoxin
MKILVGLLLAVSGFAATIPAADLSQFKTADALWLHIRQMQQQGPSEQGETEQQRKRIAKSFLNELVASLAVFCKQYPADARRWQAKLTQIRCGIALADIEGRFPDQAADEKVLKEIAAATDAAADMKAQACVLLIEIHADRLMQSTGAAAIDAFAAEIDAFEKHFPKDPNNVRLRMLELHVFEKADPAKTESLMKTLAKSGDPTIAGQAQSYLSTKELLSKPLQLKFTAVDGAVVDLENLRGKVVLLDFWATWCGPCVISLPKVIAAYGKYHDKGFEIVGISLDQDKGKLLAFTKQRGMIWPQYFDGKVWQNEISARFHINAIPATWLVDKKGYIHQIDVDALPAQTEKLLSE